MTQIRLDLEALAEEIASFCERWGIATLSLFGSAVREQLRADSDVDVIVAPLSASRWTALDLVTMREELVSLFGRPVDLLTTRGLATSRNSARAMEILSTARVIYAAA